MILEVTGLIDSQRTNSFGKSVLNLCFILGCVILNGCCNGDRGGEYMYVLPHGSSVINYFLTSEDFFSANLRVGNCGVFWYMPVELCWNNVTHNIEKPVSTESREERNAWSDEFMVTYTDELCSPEFKLCVQEAISALSTNVDKSTHIIVRAS